jgi:hypothetical protein
MKRPSDALCEKPVSGINAETITPVSATAHTLPTIFLFMQSPCFGPVISRAPAGPALEDARLTNPLW